MVVLRRYLKPLRTVLSCLLWNSDELSILGFTEEAPHRVPIGDYGEAAGIINE